MQERYIASVDLGTSKIAVCVAKVTGDNVQMIYYRERPAEGIRYSYVFNPGKASVPLKKAIADAEDELGMTITQVVVGLPRFDVKQISASSRLDRSQPEHCISAEEIEMLKENALTSFPLPEDGRHGIYGAIAQSFSADDLIQQSEDDVIGSVADSLDGNFKIFVGSKRASENLDRIFNNLGIAINRKVFTPWSTVEAVLAEEEKDNGVGLIEIGAGVTSLSIYQGGILRHFCSIPFGAGNVTADIKHECGFKEALAENIKLAYGACMPEKLSTLGDKTLRIMDEETGMYDDLPAKYLSEIITCRMREIMEAMLYCIQEAGFSERLRNGLVITGGGAGLTNLVAMTKEMSGYSVRIGYPKSRKFSSQGCPGINEAGAATTVGLILGSAKDPLLNCVEDENAEPQPEAAASLEAPAPVQSTYVAPEQPARAYSEQVAHPYPEQPARPEASGREEDEQILYGGLGSAPEPNYDETVFGQISEEERQRTAKRKKAQKPKKVKAEKPARDYGHVNWIGTVSGKVSNLFENAFDHTIGSLFDEMGKNDNSDNEE